ncbi:MAG: YebC/PmpR family DNA-binding transcriptional regulator [Candidatus Moranbacteria bacterium]|nr:YebC/PmpR family DNA-binding transcriptional regulator [Candidatus Moranbacteria bacterium]
MSGHNKWSGIKHRKEAQDSKRSKIFSRLAKAIIISVQSGGNDIEKNSTLKIAIEQAKKANMPKDNINRAIKRGLGQSGEGKIEEVFYEAYFPTNTDEMIAMMILCATDNINRTVSEIKSLLKKNSGKFVPNGSVSFQFEEVGQFILETEKSDNFDFIELAIIEAGAKDLEKVSEKEILVITEKINVQKVYKKLEKDGFQVKDLKINYISKQPIIIDKETKMEYNKLFEIIDSQDDVQEIFDNVE